MVFDVGANVGHMSALFTRHFPEANIHALEPTGSTYTKLQREERGDFDNGPFRIGEA